MRILIGELVRDETEVVTWEWLMKTLIVMSTNRKLNSAGGEKTLVGLLEKDQHDTICVLDSSY